VRLPGPDFPAPAKLNLFLHIVGRRADGYHLLQSVFTLIDHHDRLRFAVRRDGQVRRVNDVPGVPEAADLAVRAARALQAASGTSLGVDIEVEKHIPMGGGLGGGSSDAATVLLALDRLWGLGRGPEAWMELGARLGSDVPFFLFGRPAWVEGVGDRLAPVMVPPRWYVVLVPRVHVPTPEVFAAPELTRDAEPLKIEDFSAHPERFRNVMEQVVAARYPEVGNHLAWLRSHGDARMTGSGGCVFAAYERREEADRVLGALPGTMKGFVARGLGQHPLAPAATAVP
jgi:4-diphosphocytidyl-2-C-methyl-D-erythritol kinase